LKFFYFNSESELFILNGKGTILNSCNNYLNPLLPETRMSLIEIKTNTFKSCLIMIGKKLKLLILTIISLLFAFCVILIVSLIRYKMIEYKIERYERQFTSNSTSEVLSDKSSKFTIILSYDICRLINDQFFEDYILVFISFPLTMFIYLWNAYRCNIDHHNWCRFSKLRIKRNKNLNDTNTSSENSVLTDHEATKVISKKKQESRKSIADNLCFTFSLICRRLKLNRMFNLNCTMCGLMCSCHFTFPVPINPFSKRNRFITAVIYAAYTYNILKIFEYLMIGDQHIQAGNRLLEESKYLLENVSLSNLNLTDINKGFQNKYDQVSQTFNQFSERGILMDLLKQICNVVIIGLRYYPVLLCVELKRKSKLIYFLTTLYVLFLFVSYLYLNIFCLLSASAAIKEANSQYNSNFLNEKLNLNFIPTSTAAFGELKMPSNLIDNKKKQKKINDTIFAPSFQLENSTKIQDLAPLLRNLMHYAKSDKLKTISDNLISIEINTNFSKDTLNDKFKFNKSELDFVKNTLFLNNIMYEKFLFYAVLCLITLNMMLEFFLLVKKSIYSFIRKLFCFKDVENEKKISTIENKVNKYKHEINYTKRIYKPNQINQISYIRYIFEKYIYKNDPDFRFSKQFINTQIISFILLYYITCIIIRKSKLIVNLSSNILIFLISFIFKTDSESSSFIINSKAQLNTLIKSLFDHISNDIVAACCLTSGIYILQLFLGLRNYKKNVLNSYKGIYNDIPSPKLFSNTKLTSSSLHYR